MCELLKGKAQNLVRYGDHGPPGQPVSLGRSRRCRRVLDPAEPAARSRRILRRLRSGPAPRRSRPTWTSLGGLRRDFRSVGAELGDPVERFGE